jgi:branched-chain amino acid transport system permease protein
MSERILQLIIAGIFQGGVYGLLAMGLSLQYGVCRVLNITHGEFVMLGAILTYVLRIGFNVNPLLAPVIIGPLMFVIGFVLHTTLFRTLKAWAPSPAVFEGNALLAAFGVMYIIENIARINWSGRLFLSYYLADKVSFLGMDFTLNQPVIFAIALVLGVTVFLFLSRSRMGRGIRATAEDPGTAGLMGVNTNMTLAFSFGLGALLAGVAGTLISIRTVVSTSMGFDNTVIALIVVTLGGLGSIPGSFIAGIIIGIVSMLVSGLWEPVLTVTVYYAMLMILLLVRPTGILGKK